MICSGSYELYTVAGGDGPLFLGALPCLHVFSKSVLQKWTITQSAPDFLLVRELAASLGARPGSSKLELGYQMSEP